MCMCACNYMCVCMCGCGIVCECGGVYIPDLFVIVQDGSKDMFEQFKVHDEVQQVHREVEVVQVQPNKAETAVEDVVEDHLQKEEW